MPSSTSLPEQPAPLPGASTPVATASHLERMQAELKIVQQQALATQKSLLQLESRTPADPTSAIVSDLPGVPAVDSTLLGVGTVVVLAGAALWSFVRQRARNRRGDRADNTRTHSTASATAPVSTRASVAPATTSHNTAPAWVPSTSAGEFSTNGFETSSAQARLSRDIAFDSEAAATEVVRVRKSLADKRVARASYLDREEVPEPNMGLEHGTHIELDLDLDAVHTPPEPTPESTPEPELDLQPPTPDLDLPLDPWLMPGESLPGADAAGEAIHFSLALEDYGVTPNALTAPEAHTPPHYELSMDPLPEAKADVATHDAPELQLEPQTGPEHGDLELGGKGYDFTITMALAQESAALELWAEARDLATEVLASDNAALVRQAADLLELLNQLEQEAPPETNWSTVR